MFINKFISKLPVLILIFIPSLVLQAKILDPDHAFGKRADKIVIDVASLPQPVLSKTKKAFLTENKFGFDLFGAPTNIEDGWVVDSFINDIKKQLVQLL